MLNCVFCVIYIFFLLILVHFLRRSISAFRGPLKKTVAVQKDGDHLYNGWSKHVQLTLEYSGICTFKKYVCRTYAVLQYVSDVRV